VDTGKLLSGRREKSICHDHLGVPWHIAGPATAC
jgi:hypothetical protein